MDHRQYGHPSMRTSHRMRQNVRRNISNFFRSAQDAIPEPNYFEELKPNIAKFKIPPDINHHFYAHTWTRAYVSIIGYDSISFTIPENQYGSNKADANWALQLTLNPEKHEISEVVMKYKKRIKDLQEADAIFTKGAMEALEELTVERALTRLPELKRFIDG